MRRCACTRSPRDYAAQRGIILADTKFEFGTDADGRLYVMDEMLTPDSSRYWPADEYQVGHQPAELRQAVRARLPGDAGLGQDRARPAPAGRGDRTHARQVRRGAAETGGHQRRLRTCGRDRLQVASAAPVDRAPACAALPGLRVFRIACRGHRAEQAPLQVRCGDRMNATTESLDRPIDRWFASYSGDHRTRPTSCIHVSRCR